MRKAITGENYLFEWNAPAPLSEAPTLTVTGGTLAFSSAMTQSRADVTVTGIATDRRTLTLSASADSLNRDQAKGYLVTNGDTWFSVTISRVVDTTAILAEPLPREINLDTSATLVFSMYYATVTSAAVTGVSGYYSYSVAYSADQGSQNHSKVEKGTLKATPKPFDTGLDHDELVETFANLADMIPRRQSDFSAQIKASLDEIALVIRNHLSADDLTEDEVFNAESFKLAHAYCTAARVYELALQLDIAAAMRARCEELLERALESVTLDIDGDGVIDEGEENIKKKGGSASDFRASWRWYSKSANDSFFTPKRGMRH
jgi:ferritin-like protein